jgi:hypothetical protein
LQRRLIAITKVAVIGGINEATDTCQCDANNVRLTTGAIKVLGNAEVGPWR